MGDRGGPGRAGARVDGRTLRRLLLRVLLLRWLGLLLVGGRLGRDRRGQIGCALDRRLVALGRLRGALLCGPLR